MMGKRKGVGKSSVEALRDKDVNLYSDLVLNNMGSGLADDVSQGNAAGDEFRTAPLWGLGKRLFFLHDRREDLLEAIHAHAGFGSGHHVPSGVAVEQAGNGILQERLPAHQPAPKIVAAEEKALEISNKIKSLGRPRTSDIPLSC